MRAREQNLKDIRESLARLAQPQRVERADGEAMQLLQAKLTQWRGLLRAHVPQARQIVRKLLADRITFTPDRELDVTRSGLQARYLDFSTG